MKGTWSKNTTDPCNLFLALNLEIDTPATINPTLIGVTQMETLIHVLAFTIALSITPWYVKRWYFWFLSVMMLMYVEEARAG